jgi:MFS family permease
VRYVFYNLAATLISVPAGWHRDLSHPIPVLAAGAPCFAAGYTVLAADPRSLRLLAVAFILAGLGIGCGVTAESAAVAKLVPPPCEASRSGCWPRLRRGANLAASAIAGIPRTVVSPAAAFGFLAAAMIVSVPLIPPGRRPRIPPSSGTDIDDAQLGKQPSARSTERVRWQARLRTPGAKLGRRDIATIDRSDAAWLV